MIKPSRVCPLCEKSMDTLSCEECNVPSVELSMMEEGDETLTEGMIIADRYRIEKILGRGAMGSVYEAIQLSVDRRVAIKTLQKQLLNEYRLVQRFYREARAASQLDHPNVIQTYDFGIDPATNVPYIAMEYLDGYELTDMIDERHSLPEEETCAILGQVAAGLVEAHEKGVIHRDLKPQNIRVRVLSDGELQAKVLDFGIAKVVRDQDSGGTLTGTGMTVGTPPYMSPEQILGEGIDARADLYSLGCILHECLTGRLPFWSDDRLSIVTLHLTGKRPELPDVLCDGNAPTQALRDLHKCLLARHKTERPPHARIVAKILKKLAIGKSVDVKKILLSATTHEQSTPVEKRRSDRNVALLSSARTDDSIKTGHAMSTGEAKVIASAPTMVAMDTGNGPGSDSLLTGPDIPSDGSSVDLNTFGPRETGQTSRGTGPKLVVLAAVVATIVAVTLVIVLGGGKEDRSKVNNDAPLATSEPANKQTNQDEKAASKNQGSSESETSERSWLADKEDGTTRVRLESIPAGISVESAGEYLGKTPLEVSFTGKTTKRLMRLSQPGYQLHEVVMERGHQGPYTVVMQKKSRGKELYRDIKGPKAGRKTVKPADSAENNGFDAGTLPGLEEARKAMDEGSKMLEESVKSTGGFGTPKKTRKNTKPKKARKNKKSKRPTSMPLW